MKETLLMLFLFATFSIQAQTSMADPNPKKYNRAIKKFNTEKDSVANRAEFYYKRGGIRQDYFDLQGAVADYNKSILANPTSAKTWYNRGLAKLDLTLYNEAIIDFNKSIELDPKTYAYNNRGICRYELKEYMASIEDYNAAIALDENNAEAYNNRGASLMMLGRLNQACEDLHKAYDKGDKASLIAIKKFCGKK